MPTNDPNAIVVLSTFPPRECGLATFASFVVNALKGDFGEHCDVRVIAMVRESDRNFSYPDYVVRQIRQGVVADYVAAAEAINRDPAVRVVHVQHEFGIFGGEFGEHLLSFTAALTKPVVVTCHTVLPDPPPKMREVIGQLANQAARLITMTETSRRLMIEVYGVEPAKLVVIPHGIMPMAYDDQTAAKAGLGFAGRTVLLTFGLLSQNKGIEYVIEALPAVVARHPDVLYVVSGATHPEILAREGEAYRDSLVRRIHELGLDRNVHFHNEFISNETLQVFLHSADIYVATSLDPNQAVSGTLTFAMGSGRAVISTAFAQAREVVTEETGLLVDFRNPAAYAAAINTLLDDPARRERLGTEAFTRTRRMTWPNVGLELMRLFVACAPELDKVRLATPALTLAHVRRLTDDFGMLQFSIRNRPDVASGYAVDDQARALLAAMRHFAKHGGTETLDVAKVYVDFLAHAGRPTAFTGMFGADRRPSTTPNGNQEDAQGRLVMALARTMATNGLPSAIHEPVWALLDEWLAASPDFKSTRAAAFLVLGLTALVRAGSPDARLRPLITRHCDHLASLYEHQRSDDWEWFEPCISYSNGAICEALLAGGSLLGNARWLGAGQRTLDFLIGKTFLDGRYVAIGQSHWCRRGEPRAFYDQQPEDVATMVSALAAAATLEPAGPYAELQRTAFEWFLGRNTLGQFVYNVATGGCYDGLGEHAVNINQGAESTVAYWLARLEA